MSDGVRFDILGIGTVAVDDFVHVDRYPPADEKEPIRGEDRHCGGQIATALAAGAKLGARCSYAGVLGDDDLSNYLRQNLEKAGVDCASIVRREGTGPIHSVIVVDDRTHSRNIFFNLHSIKPLSKEQITEPLVAGAKVLLIDQLGPDGMVLAALHAREQGIPVVGDMEWPDAARRDELMRLIDHLIVPRDFGTAVTGVSDPAELAAELHRRSPRTCTVVTCGKDGCYYVIGSDPGTVLHQPAFKVRVGETTGCGDVFHGAYSAALAWGLGIVECVLTASAAAAVYASRPNGWQHLPDRADVSGMVLSMRV